MLQCIAQQGAFNKIKIHNVIDRTWRIILTNQISQVIRSFPSPLLLPSLLLFTPPFPHNLFPLLPLLTYDLLFLIFFLPSHPLLSPSLSSSFLSSLSPSPLFPSPLPSFLPSLLPLPNHSRKDYTVLWSFFAVTIKFIVHLSAYIFIVKRTHWEDALQFNSLITSCVHCKF